MSGVFDPRARQMLEALKERRVDMFLSAPMTIDPTKGDHAHAAERLMALLTICQRLEDWRSHGCLLERYGQFLQGWAHLSELDTHLSIALAQPELRLAQKVALTSLHARQLIHQGAWARAEEVLDRAWTAAICSRSRSELLSRRASLLNAKGEYEASQRIYEEALLQAEEAEDKSLLSTVWNNLGNLAYARDHYRDALQHYQRALEIAEETEETLCQARAAGGLGMTLDMLNQHDGAIPYHEQARRQYEAAGDAHGLVRADLNHCYSIRMQGDYATATELASRARAEAHRLGDPQREAEAFYHLGELALCQLDYESAYSFAAESLRLRLWLGKPLYIEGSYRLVHRLMQTINDDPALTPEERTEWLRQCRDLWQGGPADASPPAF